MLYHSNYLGYTGLSYIGSSVTSDFFNIPQQFIFLSYTVFGKIMDSSQRLQRVRLQTAHLSERHEDCTCNLMAFCTQRRHGNQNALSLEGLLRQIGGRGGSGM
jgi:hypothetical protein